VTASKIVGGGNLDAGDRRTPIGAAGVAVILR
jgi:hypothetical protein